MAALALALFSAGCTRSGLTCNGLAVGGNTFSLTSCSDHLARDVTCTLVPPGPATTGPTYSCQCHQGGTLGRTFPMTDPTALSNAQTFASVANPQCGWSLTVQ